MWNKSASSIGLVGYFGACNLGDEAILSCLLDGIRTVTPDWKPVVFTSDPAYTRQLHSVESLPATIPANMRELLVGLGGRNRRNFVRTLRGWFALDAVHLGGGGGLLFDNPDSNRHLIRLLRKVRVASLLRKRVLLTGVGVGPIHHRSSVDALRRTLASVDLLAVRDEISKSNLANVGICADRIHVTADYAYLLRSAPSQRADDILEAEGLNDFGRNLPLVGITLHGQYGADPSVLRVIGEFCRHVSNSYCARVLLMPMQYRGVCDRSLFDVLIENYGVSATILQGMYSPQELQAIIGRLDALVGQRLHSLVFAANAKTPFLGIAYKPKVTRFFREIGRCEWCIPVMELSAENLARRFTSIWQGRQSAQQKLTTTLDTLRQRARQNLTLIESSLCQSHTRNVKKSSYMEP